MNKEEQLTNAIIFATNKHSGQHDKAGMPYILHPLAVMNMVNTIDEKIVAVLHDVIEDTDATKEDLLLIGMDRDLINDVLILSHDGVNYQKYIENIKAYESQVAINVKIADLTHNSDLNRLKDITPKDKARLEKYKKAIEFLRQ